MIISIFIEKLIELDLYYDSRNHNPSLISSSNLNLIIVMGIVVLALFKFLNLIYI